MINKDNLLEGNLTPELISLVANSLALKSKKIENLKFNFFSLTSDHYYKENYHSDLLKAFLENPIFIRFFIENISSNFPQIKISHTDYMDVEVLRELGKIDIWIRDLSSKRSIVIENKINNAIDKERQLPRYVEYVKASNYELDAIIYLSIDGKKQPEKSDWSSNEVVEIDDKLINLAGYDGSSSDLFSVFQKLELQISDMDYLVLSRHYRNLISNLSISVMNKPIQDSLYETCKDVQNFQKLKELSSLFNQLPAIRAKKIKEEFNGKCEPFKKVDIWTNKIAFFDEFKPKGEESNFAIDVTCYEDSYVVDFFDRNALENDFGSASKFLESKGIMSFEKRDGNRRMKMTFQFPKNEQELYSTLSEILSKLK